MKSHYTVLLTALLMLSGCAHVISAESRRLVDTTITFEALKQNPDALSGKVVMLGGIIAATKNTNTGSQLELAQVNLSEDGTPIDTFRSGGRFLATTPEFLDAVIYKEGRLVTLVGEVKGVKVMPLDEVDYRYPVVSIRELHVWKSYEPDRAYPYPYPPTPWYYDPYYYGYRPTPYWYRPLGPPFRR